MKKFGIYRRNPAKKVRNPAPFALTLVNPAKKRAAAKRRRTKNPVKSVPLSTRSTGATIRSAKARHHKKGEFRYNPARKLKKRRRKNPLAVKHVIVDGAALNRAKKRRKKSRSVLKNPPMKTRKRSRRKNRSRNPFRAVKRGRSRRRNRNPSRGRRRSGSRRMRNPMTIIQDGFSMDQLSLAIGSLVGIVGTRYLLNKLIQGDATGKRMFDLPGITYSSATNPMTPEQFSVKNKIALAFWETIVPLLAGYFLKGQSPRFSKGLLLSAPVNLGLGLIKGTDIGNKAGVNAFLPRGTGTFIPGVPPMLSGPATAFIQNGAPVRRGTSAIVDRAWAGRTTANGASPFASR